VQGRAAPQGAECRSSRPATDGPDKLLHTTKFGLSARAQDEQGPALPRGLFAPYEERFSQKIVDTNSQSFKLSRL